MNNIMWSYIDKEKATINVLKDYNSMKNINKTITLNSYKLKQSQDYLDWFEPAWLEMNDKNKDILDSLFFKRKSKIDIAMRLNYSERQFYRLKKEAILSFSELLFF